MRIVFFDDIAETHVSAGLARALSRLGVEVICTGPIWRGHKFPVDAADERRIGAILEDVLALRPDVLLVQRPSALTPALLDTLPAAAPVRVAWLSDDPALFRVYIAVADRYHLLLHGGCGEDTLQLYRDHGLERGVFFPFWADPQDFPPTRLPASEREPAFVFVGNCAGTRKGARYRTLTEYADAVGYGLAIFGRVDEDPRGVSRGFLEQSKLPEAVARHAVALNIPQHMGDYRGDAFDFPGLAAFGWFDVPSRLVQMAALALPVITLGPTRPSQHFSTPLGDQASESAGFAPALLSDPGRLDSLARAAHDEFLANFTAEVRARYLLALLERPPSAMTMRERVFGYRAFAPSMGLSTPVKII